MSLETQISPKYAVQMRGILKSFGAKKVLSEFNIDIKKGTVHALLGENGAGKSTLMNILYGLHRADCGKIFLNGKATNIRSPADAIKNKIGMVHQHFMLIDKFTVLENVILGNETTNKFGILNIKKARDRILKVSRKHGLNIDLDAKVEDISVGMQQRVEILKALYRDADILIFDEPTAVLSPAEIEDFIRIIRKFILEDKTVIIVTHKLREIMNSADKCTIIRSGINVDTLDITEKTCQKDLAQGMICSFTGSNVKRDKFNPGNVVLRVKNLNTKNEKKVLALKNFSLEVRAGEILGVAGVDGNGQKELVDSITGLLKVESGTIEINGKQIQNTSPRNVLDNKVSIIHEDRSKVGLILDYTVAENSVITKYRSANFSKHGILKRKSIRSFAKNLIEKYNIKPNNCANIPARNLSGGNQQKLAIAREISNEPDLLIAVQPTRGLDIGAVEHVHNVLIEERSKGRAILLISLEIDEILQISDTVCVIYNGCNLGEFDRNAADGKKVTNKKKSDKRTLDEKETISKKESDKTTPDEKETINKKESDKRILDEKEIGFLMMGGRKNDYSRKIS
ncbi:MAG: ABC transporter ATP-binding protein [Oscillospiraceae bacterium]|jgi:simple sugar transport system ATP-binding protein|nr:ABC transporter ATP-binding protein [Oscillospiraceae bacterium]